MSELLEVKNIIEKQGRDWEEFKKTNNELIAAKAEGKAVSDLEAKLSALSDSLDKLSDDRKAIEDFMARMTAPGGGSHEDNDIAAEVKGFNLAMRSEYQNKGKLSPADYDVEGYKHYKSGFLKMAKGATLDSLDSNERKAMSAGSDPDGGYLLPESTVGRVVKKVYEQSIMRQIATVQTLSGNSLEGVIDNNEASAGYVSELGTRSDTSTPQVGQYQINAVEIYAMPKVSQRLIDDASMDVEQWLADKIADKFARVEGAGFWTDTGAGKIMGLAAYATAATSDDTRAWGTFEHVKTGTNGDFNSTTKADVLHDLHGAMKTQYLVRAAWCMRREVRTKLRKLRGATSDQYLWEPSLKLGAPDQLNGYPVFIDQYMPALATDSLSLAFGDFKEAYTIVDRLGIRTLRDPYTAKPYVVFYSTKRVGGAAVNFEAVKFLKFAA